ncbi:hypothetical protein M1B72_02605 [Geomonas paludis]|uniref:Uncharacterized protein n=1 Tax=Geomonas paludis TaxID=2740185 RepID=A0A6V8N039_9BACT|nr:hypothetical protein [Geomonas paludis]UPU36614.1 hypothetical protein M1B72_02605 [Geomonas paludis]GFO65875.1 hypothetical protein GMPD_37940 [Geomonas paludis]
MATKYIVTIDIRRIRQALHLTMSQMGMYISIYYKGLVKKAVPGTRVNEWEFGYRPVPDYVFTASANLLLDSWSEDRHRAPKGKRGEVDVYYATALNEPLGELFKVELALGESSCADQCDMYKRVRIARIAQQRYLENLLGVRMWYVFAEELGPEPSLDREDLYG